MNTIRHYPSQFLLLLLAITLVIMWPLYVVNYTLQGDAADLLLPVFSHIREAIWSGDWPLWNRYQLQGIPASYTSIYWNPLYLALGSMYAAPDRAVNALYLTLVFVSGFGFYKFSSLFLYSEKTAILAGLAYPLSGFFVVQSSHISWIEAAAWTPLLLYLFSRYYIAGNRKHLILNSICFYLFATAADPAFVLTLIAILGCLAIFLMFKNAKNIKIGLTLGISTLSPSLLVWMTYYQQWKWFGEMAGKTSTDGGLFSLQPWLLSFLFPRASTMTSVHKGTDSSLYFHSFIGIIVIILAGYTLWSNRNRSGNTRILRALAILITLVLIAGFFATKPVYLFEVSTVRWSLPLFLMLAGSLLILGLRGLEALAVDTRRKKWGYLFGGIGAIFLLFAFLGPSYYPISPDKTLFINYIRLDLWKSSFFLLSAGILLVSPLPVMGVLGSLLVVELGAAHFLNQDSGLYHPYPSEAFSSKISHPERMNSVPDLNLPVGGKTDQDFQLAGLNRNTGTLFKKIVRDGYWPWLPVLHSATDTNLSPVPWLRYPLFYFSQDTTPMVYPDFSNFDAVIEMDAHGDHDWELSILSYYEKYLVFNQNFDAGWKARLDGQWIPIHRTGTGMMKIDIPAGLHSVQFTFDSGGLIHLFWTTMVLFTLGIVYLIRRKNFPFYGLAVFLPGLILLLSNLNQEESVLPAGDKIEQKADPADFQMNYESGEMFWFVRPEQIIIHNSYDGYRSEELNDEAEYSATLVIPRLSLKGKESLGFQFQIQHPGERHFAVVLKIYSRTQDKYNIQYIESLNSDEWHTLKGQFDLDKLYHGDEMEPLIKAEFYIWNYKKQDFIIDDIQLKLNP